MEDKEEYLNYKIDTKHNYKIYCQEYNGKRFYKVMIQKKNYDGTKTNFYKQIRFVKCKPPLDGEIIRIKKGFEDVRENKNDRYSPIFEIVVMDYEVIQNDVVDEKQAFAEFQNNLKENEEGYADFGDVEITDDMIAF